MNISYNSTIQLVGIPISQLLYKQKQDAVIRYLASRFKTKTSRSKQRRLLLSR